MCGGVQVISQSRRKQHVRLQKRAQPVAAYCAPHPGTPHTRRIRGGQEGVALVGSARWSVCSHHPKRFVIAMQDEGEETSRSLSASDLPWRTLDMGQGQPLRGRVEVCMQDWKV
jgi:hypothetical protein